MKSIFKKIAFVLALAMVVTAFPAQTAAAASEIPYLKAKRVLYLGGDVSGEYPDATVKSVYATSNRGDYKVQFASDNEDVVEVTPNKGKLTPKKVGTANVIATFTKAGAETITKTCVVTVKKNAAIAGVDAESEEKLTQLVVGDKFTVVPTRTDADGNMVTGFEKDVITDALRFKSSNTEIFTVDLKTGEIEAVGVGEAELIVYAVEYEYFSTTKAKKGYDTLQTVEANSFPVVVSNAGLVDVKQTNLTTFQLTTTNAETAKAITADNLEVNYLLGDIAVKDFIKSVAVSDQDDKVVVVELLNLIAADRKYQVSYNDTTVEFTGVKANPYSISIETGTAVIEVPTEVKIKFYTVEGVEITNDDLVNSIELTPQYSDDYYISGHEIYFYEANKTAEITATYDMGYDNDGNELTDLTAKRVIISINADQTIPNLIDGFAASTIAPTEVNDDLKNLPFSMNTIRLATGDSGYKLYARYTVTTGSNTENAYIYDGNQGDFVFSTTNEAVLAVYGNNLYPNSAGSASVVVYDQNNKVMGVVNVIVEKERVFTTFDAVPDKTRVAYGSGDSITVTITAKDQLGTDMPVPGVEVTQLSPKPDSNLLIDSEVLADGKVKITATANADITAKTAVVEVKVTIGGVSKLKRLTVYTKKVDPDIMSDTNKCRYQVSVDNSALDTKLGADKQSATVTVTVTDSEGYYLGELEDVSPISTIPNTNSPEGNYLVITKDGKPLEGLTDTTFRALTTTSGSAVTGSAIEVTATKAANGQYTATVYSVSSTVRVLGRTNFSVTDSTVPLVATLTNGMEVTGFDNLDFQEVITLMRGNDRMAWSENLKIFKVNFGNAGAVSSRFVTSIVVRETVNGVSYDWTVSVNKLFRQQQ